MTMRTTGSGRGLRHLVLWGALVVVMAACSPIMRFHGYAPTDQELQAVNVGDTREQVTQAIGQPGIGGVMEGSGWFYVQSDWRHAQWRAPVETDRQLVAITFDARDRVANIERFGLEDGQVVAISRRITDTGPRPSVLSQVFRVLGQFTAGSFS